MWQVSNMRAGLMGSPIPGYGNTYDEVSEGGAMDVLGSLKKHSNYATRYQSDATGGMAAGPLSGFGMGGTSPFSYGS